MKKILSIIATTFLGTTTITNWNLISQIQLNNQLNKISNVTGKDKSNPFIQQVNGIPDDSIIDNITVAPNGAIYACYVNNSGDYDGLYYSTDGINFQQVNGISDNSGIKDVTVAPNGTVYVGENDGLYYSTDGINFQQVNGIPDDSIIDNIIVAPNGTVYVGIDNMYKYAGKGLYYSTDGINFQQVNGIPDDSIIDNITVAPSGTIYASIDNEIVGSYDLWYSTDGINFKQANGLSSSITVYDVTVAPNGTVYVETDNGLYCSTDGINFQQLNGIPNNSGIKDVTVAPNGTVYVGTDNGLYCSTDGINFQQLNGIPNNSGIDDIIVAPNGTVYVGTDNGLYCSTDGINFQQLNGIPNNSGIDDIIVAPNGTVYVGTDNGLYCINLKNKLFFLNSKPNYLLNNQFVYDEPTNISISSTYLQSASLDGKSLTLPSKNLNLNFGKHTLTLTMKNEYKQYAGLFGKNNNGIITYNFWIKDTIADNQYSVNDDTSLYQGLISNAGNTNGVNIIQTESNAGSSHPAELNVTLQDKLLDLNNSYYVSGTVDTNNDFTATGSKVFLINNQLTIKNNGIYQIHLVDKVGNTQDTYLELGSDYWKINGTFDDKTFDYLKTKLNVTVEVTDPTDKQIAMTWLNQYKIHADKSIIAEVKKYGAGFNITVADLPDSYKTFLDSTTYTDQGGTEKINLKELDNAIKEAVQNKINSGLNIVSSLTKKYNISTSNVIDSNSLNSYVSWINNYDSWFNKNETTILTNEINKISHGYASQSEIKNILANINTLTIFNNVNWNVKTDSNYQQFINYQNLDQAILKADSSQTWEAQYQADLKIQESNLSLHGYTIVQVLGNKQEPQTKSQMENYDNSGESFHTWLQTEANSKYHKYQLDTGLEIGLPLFVLVSLISLTWYYRNTKKYKLFVFKRTNIKNKEKVDD